MQVLLSCTECEYEQWGNTDKELMNKIIIWNHVKKEHPATAERVMRVYQHVPSSLFNMHAARSGDAAQKLNPRFA